jgi:hypothetical protein
MQSLADLLAQHHIPLTVVAYPWPAQIELDDRDSRQSAIWRKFCATNCKTFIDLFPVFFGFKDSHPYWYERLFIAGDVHLSPEGNELVFSAIADRLLSGSANKAPANPAQSSQR